MIFCKMNGEIVSVKIDDIIISNKLNLSLSILTTVRIRITSASNELSRYKIIIHPQHAQNKMTRYFYFLLFNYQVL